MVDMEKYNYDNVPPIKKDVIIRIAVLVFALVNQALVGFDMSPLPFTDEKFEQGVSILLTTSASIWAWWKNNSITRKERKKEQLASLEPKHHRLKKI